MGALAYDIIDDLALITGAKALTEHQEDVLENI
jgi:hypothetical protein